MSWREKLPGQGRKNERRTNTISIDFTGHEHLYKWIASQAEEYGCAKAVILRACLQDAYDDDHVGLGSKSQNHYPIS
jgi:hypothetical protein